MIATSLPSILMVEDTLPIAAVYKAYLKDEPYKLSLVTTGVAALEFISKYKPDLILLDLQLPDMDGMEILSYICEQQLEASVIVMTAHGSVDIAVEAMRLGAKDYLSKPISAERLKVTLTNILQLQELNQLVANYKQDYERKQFQGFVGSSQVMQSIYRLLESAATSSASVFITGNSGTGKELCAQAIHDLSSRRKHELVTLNCAAIPHNLMESEIFGHVKGAFTGAITDRVGAAGLADGGTLFLDELCEMDLSLQSKLLRFIQTGTFQRVGESRLRKVNLRFVCATNKEPLAEVAAGRFREDLYYRLYVLPVHLPPLRDRGSDVIEIAEFLLAQIAAKESKNFSGLAQDARVLLQSYAWPGNIRQLQNIIYQAVVLNSGGEITASMLPQLVADQATTLVTTHLADPKLVKPQVQPEKLTKDEILPLHLTEKLVIEQAIELCLGNIPKAAAALEVSPSTIYRKLQSWQK